MPGRPTDITSLLTGLLLAGALLTLPAAAQSTGPDGHKLGDERLRPGVYPAPPVPEPFAVPIEPSHPPFQIDWSVGLRGTIVQSTDGDSFVTRLSPQFTAIHDGLAADIAIEGSAELAKPSDDALSLTATRLGIAATAPIDSTTTASANASIDLSHPLAGTPGLSPFIIEPPDVATANLGLGIDRRFGLFNLGASAGAVRTVYGPTVRTDTGTTDNSDQNLWTTEASLRLGYQATPIFEVYGEATVGRDIFDLPSSSLNAVQDATSRTLRAGVAGTWNSILQANVSMGVTERGFDDPSLEAIATQVYGASITYTPDPTLRLTAALDSNIAPPGADATGRARIEHTASANVDYTVNSWLRVRASADWSTSTLVGSNETETRYGLGAGADYTVNAHTALTADYGYGKRINSTTGEIDTHQVSVGIVLKR